MNTVSLVMAIAIIAWLTAPVTQGGDWGSHITRVMGSMYPQHVKGQYVSILTRQSELI